MQDDDRRWGSDDRRYDDRGRRDDCGGPISNTLEATKEMLSYAKEKAEEEASRLKQKAEETAGAALYAGLLNEIPLPVSATALRHGPQCALHP